MLPVCMNLLHDQCLGLVVAKGWPCKEILYLSYLESTVGGPLAKLAVVC